MKYTIFIVFFLIGLGLMFFSFKAMSSTRAFVAGAEKSEGTVVRLFRSTASGSSAGAYRPVVKFTTASGQTIIFTSSFGSDPPKYSEGQRVEVAYLPSSPQRAKINDSSLWFGEMVFAGFGVLFMLFGGLPIVFDIRKRKRDLRLKAAGRAIVTAFQCVEVDRDYDTNQGKPFCIRSQWENPETRAIHVFKSDRLSFDPTAYIPKDHNIEVFVDGVDLRKYCMDLSFLPKGAD